MNKDHTIEFSVTWEKYQEIKKYARSKEYDSMASFVRTCLNREMKRNPVGPGKPKRKKKEQ